MTYNLPSIPSVNYYNFSLPIEEQPLAQLQVGGMIKDQEDGTITSAKIAYDKAVVKAESDYEADMVKYKEKHDAASIKAKDAELEVQKPRKMKAASITALVLSILTSVGLGIAGAVTGTLPLLFIAIPFALAIAPSGYFTNKYCKLVNKLDKIINAPKKMAVPQKAYVKPYHVEDDLDLRSTRINALNTLAQKTISGLAQSKWSKTQMLNYGLLDYAINLTPSTKSAFYAKTFQLIDAYHSMNTKKSEAEGSLNYQHRTMQKDLDHWKSEQDCQIQQREHDLEERQNLHDREWYRDRREGQPHTIWHIGDTFDITSSRNNIESYKHKIAITYGQMRSDISHWYQQSHSILETEHQRAIHSLETRYRVLRQS